MRLTNAAVDGASKAAVQKKEMMVLRSAVENSSSAASVASGECRRFANATRLEAGSLGRHDARNSVCRAKRAARATGDAPRKDADEIGEMNETETLSCLKRA